MYRKTSAIRNQITFRNLGEMFQYLYKDLFRDKFLDPPFVGLNLENVTYWNKFKEIYLKF